MTGEWEREGDRAAALKALRDNKGCGGNPRIGKGKWSPISPDRTGGWWLYGEHYDTREQAETALAKKRVTT